MKKTTLLKIVLLTFVLLQAASSYAQTYTNFTPRYNDDIKGDMLLIGNSILNRKTNADGPNTAYNGSGVNGSFSMQYVNIDNGATAGIFNSSSANLVVPNSNKPNASCYKIRYAALYWGAVTKGATAITDVKFKMPTGGYNNVTGTVIYNAGTTKIGTSYPYACFADVTALVTGATNPTPEGTYTVANVSTAVSSNSGTGLSAGWSLFIVYEDPKLPTKAITSFDGFTAIDPSHNLDIPVSGFRTIPTGNVRTKFAFAALEGDQAYKGDYLAINGNTISVSNAANTVIRASNNFFNSSVTYVDPTSLKSATYLDRNPASTNTLGYDSGVFELNNNNNSIIKNNDTSATISLRSTQDIYFYYFNAIAVDIIAPEIVLTKQVFDNAAVPNNLANTNVTRGTNLYYYVGFQNIGNDNAQNFTIKDILPVNINFDPNDIVIPNGSGITYTYNAATRTIVFTIPKELVEVNDPRYVIKFKVQVVPECNDLSDACSTTIQNQAFASYKGVTSSAVIDDQLSLSTFDQCYIGTAAPTNFLVGLEDCKYTKDYQLCGSSVVLTAANGYSGYSWSTSATGTPVIGTTKSITVTQTGTYYVRNTAPAPCRSITEEVTVSPSGTTVKNPIIPFADITAVCPNNKKDLPKIFLCGAKATRLLKLSVTDAESIIWQKLDEASCTAIANTDCANEASSCVWNQVTTGSSYTADTAGQYRVVLHYKEGCFNIYYFNVFKNLLDPTATKRDIICDTAGQITVGGVPGTGYEFSLSATGPFQDSNVFTVPTSGNYTVYIKQKGVATNPCLFSVPNIDILKRNFTVSEFIGQPLCNTDKGSIKLAANDVREQYYYSISKAGTVVNSVGPIVASDYTFSNLSAGVYTYIVKTSDGCLKNGSFEIIPPAVLSATVNQTKAITCEGGEITVTPVGGTSPYGYYVNGSTVADYSNVINTPTAGLYAIKVVDFNGCVANTSITVAAVPKPVYNTTGTNVKCYGDASGVINFNVTNANGYTLSYSTDNGVTYGTSAIISNLSPGTYNTILKYTLNGVECIDTMKSITISQPSTALTASAGVSALAGCGVNKTDGTIRITNPDGGTPFPAPNLYLYSFDNQATWITTNQADKAPGTYTVYIKDANGCIYAMPNIVIDPKPVAPVIDVATPVDFNCDGTATSTVTITNPSNANFTYSYYMDGVLNTNATNPNVFLNVLAGTHSVKVVYKLVAVTTYSNLLYETFGYGDDTTSPGINSVYYCFERQVAATQCKGSPAINDGDYSVTAKIQYPFGAWIAPVDHTPATTPVTPKGRFMVVNIGATIPKTEILYQKTINDIIPNQPINVEFYAMNLLNKNNTQFDPDLVVALVNSAGVEISSYSTGNIPKSEKWEKYPTVPITLNPGSNTTLKFIVRSNVQQTSGNDVAFDDIKVYQLPVSCAEEKILTVVVPDGKAFNATVTSFKNVKCNGETNGEITITAENFNTTSGYQYSRDNGTTWLTTTTSPLVLTGLGAAGYNVLVRYNATSTGGCVKTLTQTITAPAAVVVTASVTKQATCITGATITANTTGGTTAYRYELWNSTKTTIVKPSQNTGAFNDIAAGSYFVRVYDANNCTDDTDTAVVVTAPAAPTATIVANTARCFDPATGANITVNVAGGLAPYSYQTSTNGGTSYGGSSASFSTASFTYNASTTGSYTFKVTDANGCTATTASQVINAKLTANAAVTTDLDCDAPPANQAVITGTISGGTAPFTVIKTGAAATGTLVQPTASGTTFTYTTDVAGTYNFQITDAIGCVTTASATINALVPVTGTATVTDVTCFNAANGSVTLAATTGVAPFTYSFNNSAFTATTTYPNLPGSVAGTSYNYVIKDNKGCTYPGTVSIKQPEAIAISASITTTYNCDHAATITALATKGNGSSYTYTLYRGATTVASNGSGIFSGITTAGSYTVQATDSKSCSITSSPAMTIVALNPPTAMTITNTALKCTTNKVDVTIAPVTGGTGTLSYTITAPAAATTNVSGATTGIFTNLDPGTYTFQVKDANNCTFSKSHTITALPAIAASAVVVNNVKCFGTPTGSIKYTISGFATGTPYSYTIDGGTAVTGTATGNPFDITISALSAGAHPIVITNTATACTATATATVAQPTAALAISAPTITPITCTANATAVINTTGGWGSNSYTVTGPSPATTAVTQSNSTFTNLTEGGYTASVTDANGCSVATTFTIAPKVDIDASIDTANSTYCYVAGTGTTIKAIPGATANATNYMYSINGGTAQASGTFTGLVPGTYTITVSDTGTKCTLPLSAVTIASPISASTAITKDLDCTATPSATIQVSIANGYAPYSYKSSTTAGSFTGTATTIAGSSFTYSAASAGTYYFEITDSKGCTTVVSRTINAIAPPNFTYTQVNVKCNGDNTGSITVSGIPASGTYSYTLTPTTPAGTAVTQTTNVFSNLKAGDYSMVIKDSKSCDSAAQTITITEPTNGLTATATATPLTCSATNTQQAATITVTASNGTPFTTGSAYLYSFNGGGYGSSNTYTVNTAGTVTINVKDANGCTYTVPSGVTIAPLNPPTALTFAQANPITCKTTELTTDVTATVTNGTGPFTYEITSPSSAVVAATGITTNTHTFTGLAPNSYTFKVTDANGCSFSNIYRVDAVTPITVTGALVNNVSCNGLSDGSIKYDVAGNTGTFTYALLKNGVSVPSPTNTGTGNTLIFAGLSSASYQVTVTNPSTGCTAPATVAVSQPTAITTLAASGTKVYCTQAVTTITVSASGGTTPLYYAVVKAGEPVPTFPTDYNTSGIFTRNTATLGLSYTAYVVDKNGNCAQTIAVSITQDAAPTVTASAVNQCLGTGTYTITATDTTPLGAIAPVTYSLNGGGFVTTNTFTVTAAGDYIVTIKDGNGCTATSNTVTVYPKVTISAVLNKDVTCAFASPFMSNDAQITVTAAGGNGPYTYTSSPTSGTFTGNVFRTSTAGSYTFTVTDASGCSITTTTAIAVTTPVNPDITGFTQTQFIKCSGDTNGAFSVAIDPTLGQAPFKYSVNGGAYQTSNTFTGLAAGVYNVTVQDAKGCTNTDSFTIVGKSPMVIDKTVIPIQCNSGTGVSKGSIIINKITDGISAVGGTGGTAPYTYYVTGINGYNQSESNASGTTSVTFNVVDFGLYQIRVVDANGCSVYENDVLVASPPNSLGIAIAPASNCTTGGTADVTITSSFAGVGPFHFNIYSGPGQVWTADGVDGWQGESTSGSKTTTFTGLLPGVTYTFIVYDFATKCYYYETAATPIPTNSTLALTNVVGNNVKCFTDTYGSVNFDITNNYATAVDVTYQVYESFTNNLIAGAGITVPVSIAAGSTLSLTEYAAGILPVGTYYVLVKEASGANAGCSVVSTDFNIKKSTSQLEITATAVKKSNCNELGSISAEATKGTGPYRYQVVATGDPVVPANWTTTAVFDRAGSIAGIIYDVYALDSYGCIVKTPVTVYADENPTITAPASICYDGNAFTIAITGTVDSGIVGAESYSVNGSAYQSSPNFTFNAAGTYNLVIKDGNGCTADVDYVVYPQLDLKAVITKGLDCTGSPDATITLTTTGGNVLPIPNYTYTVSYNSGVAVAATSPYAATAAGDYVFTVTDVNNGTTCTTSATVTIDAIPTPTITPSVTDVSCFSGTDGAISVAVSGGVGPFTYALTSTPAITNTTGDATGVYTGLEAGTNYVVTVTDAKSCSYPTTITVGQPTAALAGSATVTTPLSCGAGNVAQAATVTLNGTTGTGTGAFEYSFDGSAYDTNNVYTVNDTGSDQNINYGIKDANGCEFTGTVLIATLSPPVFDAPSTFTQTTVTCNTPTSDVTVTSTNGIGTITYATIAPSPLPVQSNTTGNFIGLAPGEYTFLVTDGNGCTDQVNYRVNDVTKINVVEQSTTGITCSIAIDGKASLLVTGFGTGVATYQYTLDSNTPVTGLSSPTINLINLASGLHTITVLDDETGCSFPLNFTIAAPTAALAINKTVTALGCTTTGAVTITATDGWGTYDYTLTQPDLTVLNNNTGVFGGLTQTGTYNISVVDANGCAVTDNFTLVTPTPPSASIALTSDYCFDSTNAATLVITASGGAGSYEYSIDNGATWQTTDTFTGLTPGTYAVMVKDAFGCTSTAFNATIEAQLFATAVKTKEIECTVGLTDGTIRITPTGGYSPYAYKVSSDAGITFTTITATDPAYTDYTVPAAGSYVFEVTDSRGCQYVTTPAVVMTAPTAIDLIASDITTTPVDCNAPQGTNNNGTITVTLRAVNDNPDYTYILTPTSPIGTAITQSTNVFTGLTAGTYEVVVTSARGCVNTPVPVTIAAATPVVATATAAAFSCSATNTVNTTTVTVTGTGGKGTNAVTDYTYSADNTNWFTTNTFEITDTGATQNLNFYVKDANGCVDMTDTQVVITAFPKLVSAVATQVTKIDCVNLGEEILVTITGGSNSPNPFSYEVYQDGVLITATPIPVAGSTFNYTATTAGSYYEFKIFDNNTTCTITSDGYEVPLYNTMVVNATAAANVDCTTNATGKIELNITGYSGAYDYEIFNGGVTTGFTGTANTSTNPFVLTDGLVAGTTYTVQVTQTAYPQCVVVSNVVEITEPALLVLSPAITVVNKNCFNEATATVPATAVTGGTGQYLYAFVASGTAPTAMDYTTSNTATLATTTISPATTPYDVWVKDANGCTSMQPIQVTTDPLPAVTAVVDSQCASATGYTITATGSLGKGALEYSLDAISFQTANTFNVTAPGTYMVTVRDANQCTATATVVTILEPLQLDATITTTPTCTTADGVVTLTAQGGTVPANYSYSVDGSTYVSGNVFSGLAPNNYTFYVRDNTTLCTKTTAVVIDAPTTTIDFSVSQTAVTCNGGNDGTILVTLATPTTTVNNNPIYTYSIDGVNYQTSNLFQGLTTGTYTVDVRSGKGCPAIAKTITVGEPGLITVPAPTVVEYGCTTGNTKNFATITVSGETGGSTNYVNYEFIKGGTQVYFGPNNVYTEADLNGGSYTVNVYDDNGCIGTAAAAAVIKPFVALDAVTVAVTRAITCNNLEEISVTVSHIGATAPTNLSYTLVDIDGAGVTGTLYPAQTNATGLFVGLPVADYLVTVTNTDTNCSVQTVHYVNEPNTFDLTITNVVDLICYSSTDGSVDVTFVDGLITTTPPNGDDAGPFTYTVEDALGNLVTSGTATTAGPITIGNLASGTYTIAATLSQSPSCTVVKNFTITGPAEALTAAETHTEITCVAGNNDGTISATATGGWSGDYEYELVGPTAAQSVAYSTVAEFTGLTAGSYTVNVKDSKGCVDSVPVVLNNPTPIVVTGTASVPAVTCFGDTTATITAGTPTGGSGNYLYSLVTTLLDGTVTTDGPQVSNVFTNLGAGSYQVKASDTWGCEGASATITINEPVVVDASLVVSSTLTCTTDSTVTLTASGGTAPYRYSTDPNFATSTAMTGSSVTLSVPVGSYKYYVRDVNGCPSNVSNTITIDPLPALTVAVDVTNASINCKGDDSGVIVATAQGGLGNYVYSLRDGSGNALSFVATQTTPGYFTNLPAGSYTVNVVSGDCNVSSPSESITEPLLPLGATSSTTDVTCSGNKNGSITILATGGTGIIKYAISPDFRQFFDSNVFVKLDAGFYDVLVQDEKGCYQILNGIEIKEPKSINATSTIVRQEICLGDNQGAFNVDIAGGTAPYSVSLDNQTGTYTTGTAAQTQFSFTGLAGGDHKVYIIDANKCTSQITVNMDLPVNLDPVAIVEYGCTGNKASNMVTVTLHKDFTDLANVEYALDGSTTFQKSEIFIDVAPGRHSITVRYIPNGCEKITPSFTVNAVAPLAINLKDGGLNEIIATTTGGAGGYQYSVNGESYGSTNNFIIYKTDDYTVTVTDLNGCTASQVIHVDFIEIVIPNVFTPNGDGNNDTWFPLNAQNYVDIYVYVFDRYGRKIGTFRQGQAWDGKYNGAELPSGDYWYVLKLNNVKDAREFVGNITLYR